MKRIGLVGILLLLVMLVACQPVSMVVNSIQVNLRVVGDQLQTEIEYTNSEGKVIHPEGELAEDGYIAFEGYILQKQTISMDTGQQITMLGAMYFITLREYREVVEFPYSYLEESQIDASRPVRVTVKVDGVTSEITFTPNE